MTSPAAPSVDFDRNRIGQGELIAGISGLVLLISLWFKWYGVSFSAGGILKGFSIGASASAWQAFSLIDIILFLIALIAIAAAVLRGLDRMPDLPAPVSTIVTGAGGLAVLLILYRLIDTPVDTHGVKGIDVSLKFGIFLGLFSAAGVAYGGWRAMQESGASFGSLGAAGAGTAGNEPTTPMGAGAGSVSPGKEGPGAPHPGTSTGGPGGAASPPPAAPDPVPGETAGETPAGLAGEGEGGTTPPGLAGERAPDGG